MWVDEKMMKIRPIERKDYALLLSLDKKVYPTDSPVTPKILDQWYQNNPEFGVIFEENNKVKGMCITIPLNKSGWNKLISGKLAESGLDSKTIFKQGRDKEIGLHIYHIEKLDNKIKQIYDPSLKELSKIISKLNVKVCGASALCVTTSGIGLFYNKFNYRERDFINSEHILKKKGKLEIFNSTSQKELEKKLKQGYEYINRCKMLVTYPNELSLVWNYFK